MEDFEKNVMQKKYLEGLLKQFSKAQLAAKDKADRFESLMSRKSFNTLPASKKKKTLTRMLEARKEFDQATEIVDQIYLRLQELA